MVPELRALGFFYYRTYACNSFPEYFSTPFHIGTWNFPWGCYALSYTSSSRFIIVTPIVPELSALGIFTIRHMHVTVFRLSPKAGPLVMASITPASSLFFLFYNKNHAILFLAFWFLKSYIYYYIFIFTDLYCFI
jgi:hypothetical protein